MYNKIAKYVSFVTIIVLIITNLLALLVGIESPVYYGPVFGMTLYVASDNYLGIISILLVAFFIINALLGIIFMLVSIIKNKNISNVILLFMEILAIGSFVLMLTGTYFLTGAVILMGVGVFVHLVSVILGFFVGFNKNEKEGEQKEELGKNNKIVKASSLIINALSVLVSTAIFFVPLFIDTTSHSLVNFLDDSMLLKISYMVALIFYIINIALYLRTFKYYFNDYSNYCTTSKTSMYYSSLLALMFYLYSVVLGMMNSYEANVGPFIVFLITGVLLVISAIINARFEKPKENVKIKDNFFTFRVISLVLTILFTILTVMAMGSNILIVALEDGTQVLRLNGFDILANYSTYGEGYRSLALVLHLMLIVEAITLASTVILFFNKSKAYKTVSLISVVISFLFVFALFLFSRYYEIIQALNRKELQRIIESLGFTYSDYSTYVISADTFIYFILSCILLVILLVLKPYSRLDELNEIDVNIKSSELEIKTPEAEEKPDGNNEVITEQDAKQINDDLSQKDENYNFDPCPQFTELDEEYDNIKNLYNEKLLSVDDDITLPNLVKFIVEYARESRLHLSYQNETIAEFIAGLGATRLSILQGMSGTGKTSLPKIFSEAVLGECNIIEVESSWKDKNELIGYYNEFSKKFTPKKFTQSLYKASLNENVITFIVLDEMNLSRIEYYFSDFLSLMENEEDKREIKLLNIKIYKNIDGTPEKYLALSNGHTLKIPKNVWFIGTANRDESTFEISDKVYDRANTMNFNKRAPKVRSYNEPIPQKFITYDKLRSLLDEAINTFNFDIEESDIIKNVEEILAPYNISFGNRIYKQIEEYVKIYCSCFTNGSDVVNEAIEKILLNKVVSKLEFKNVENKEELSEKFRALHLNLCKEFVDKLNEDI